MKLSEIKELRDKLRVFSTPQGQILGVRGDDGITCSARSCSVRRFLTAALRLELTVVSGGESVITEEPLSERVLDEFDHAIIELERVEKNLHNRTLLHVWGG